jgi:hypothetical protein
VELLGTCWWGCQRQASKAGGGWRGLLNLGWALRQAYLVRECPKERLVWCWSGRLTLRSAWAYLEPRRRWVEEWNLRSS